MNVGPGDHEEEPAEETRRTPGGVASWLFGAWIGALVALAIVFAWLAGRDEGRNHPAGSGAAKKAAGTASKQPKVVSSPAQKLFASTCGGCHTLSAAGTTGSVGPDLGQLKPNQALVLSAIKNGGAGSGAMPKNLLAGAKAGEIAQYVAKATAGSP